MKDEVTTTHELPKKMMKILVNIYMKCRRKVVNLYIEGLYGATQQPPTAPNNIYTTQFFRCIFCIYKKNDEFIYGQINSQNLIYHQYTHTHTYFYL